VPSGIVALDPFTATADDVARKQRGGRVAACRLNPALWEPGRPDAGRFDPALLGSLVAPGEDVSAGARWLDVRRWDLIAPVLVDRLALCRAKGFQGVVAEHIDGYAGPTGFALRPDDQRAFKCAFAAAARHAGLRVVLLSDAGAEAGSGGRSTTTGS
jgi:Glycoside-hydrolase family GH114